MCPYQQPVVDHHVQLLDQAHPHQVLARAEPVNDIPLEQALYEITLLKTTLADEKKKGERLKTNYWQMKRKRVKAERKNTKKRSQNYIHQI